MRQRFSWPRTWATWMASERFMDASARTDVSKLPSRRIGQRTLTARKARDQTVRFLTRERLDHRGSRRSFAYDTNGGMARVLRLGAGAREAAWSSSWCVYMPRNEGKIRFRAGFTLGFVNVELSRKKCATKKYPAHGSLKGGGPPQGLKRSR